jgi:alpha(1,3/1,4) fucosyltransferase
MRLGIFNFYRQLNNNKMFQSADGNVLDGSLIGDDMVYPMVHLGKVVKGLGHEIATIDTAPWDSFDAVIFWDYPNSFPYVLPEWFPSWNRCPNFKKLIKSGKPLYLFISETPAIRPGNWKRSKHAPFKKVFTWRPDWVDGKKYFRYYLAHKLPEFSPYTPSTATKFCCQIASQKYSGAKEELYSERVRAIRWFEQYHPDEFDLYGQRWDRFCIGEKRPNWSGFDPILVFIYHKAPWLPRPRQRDPFPSWRGPVKSKREIMRQYRFSICYENTVYLGGITEKILDAMFAGSVPIYLGDPQVTDMIPKEAFIDKRDFPDYESLYRYMKGMSEEEYEGYRKAIHKFVHGDGVKPFGAQALTDLIVREVINDR